MGSQASGGELLMILLFCAIGFGVLYLIVFMANGGKTIGEMVENQKAEEDKRIESIKRSGPSDNEKYQEAYKLYKKAHPMICEIVKRDKKDILQMVLNPKHINIIVMRDMYRLGLIFGFTLPELKINMYVSSSNPMYDLIFEEQSKRVEQLKKNLGISEIYDDPFVIIDPYEPKYELKKRGTEIAKKYGYWSNGAANIFKNDDKWWEIARKQIAK